MTERLPLLIGITGKRQFSPELDKEIAATRRVRKRLHEIFGALDDDYPGVPKVLLTGAAFGADLIAARAALARNRAAPKCYAKRHRNRWSVAVLLPFELDEFRKDFHPGKDDPQGPGWAGRYEQYRKDFERLITIANNDKNADAEIPRVIVVQLPKLSPPTDRKSTADATDCDRDAHYEQVGQFIAESVGILIAVTPKENSASKKATGGTSRIVAYRRAGRPDSAGQAVAERSSLLRKEWSDLVAPSAAPVWLIDAEKEFSRPATLWSRLVGLLPKRHAAVFKCLRRKLFGSVYPVEPLPPLLDRTVQEVYDGSPGVDMPKRKEGASHHGPLRIMGGAVRALMVKLKLAIPLPDLVRRQHVNASLALAKAWKRFNKHKPTSPSVIAHLGNKDGLPKKTDEITELANATQMKQNARSRVAFLGLAAFFFLAVTAFEVYAKFFPASPKALGLYLAILGIVGSIVLMARLNLWQPKSEDYRALVEILRVQRAWWAAGIPFRVDREHLQGVDRDLSHIRQAVTNLIVWLMIRNNLALPRQDWRHVQLGWIHDQLIYFSTKEPVRHNRVRIAEAASWTLFVASGFVAVILWVWLAEAEWWHSYSIYQCFERAAAILQLSQMRGCPVPLLIWSAFAAATVKFRVWNRDLKGFSSHACTAILGFITAVFLSLAIVSAATYPITLFDLKITESQSAKYLMIVVLVSMSAGAGAWRYVTERLNIEAEAHDYRDAKERFRRALELPVFDAIPPHKDDVDAAQSFVRELGLLALRENEAWLKSRRERPLTPVVG